MGPAREVDESSGQTHWVGTTLVVVGIGEGVVSQQVM